MNYVKIHKNAKLTPFQRQEIWRLYCSGAKVSHLAKQFNVSRLTIYKILKRARKKILLFINLLIIDIDMYIINL